MTNQKIKIEDNFLAQVEFDKIHKMIMGSQFTWLFSNCMSEDTFMKIAKIISEKIIKKLKTS